MPTTARTRISWVNRTVLGIGLASLFSDWSHEMATAVLPTFLATLGAGAAWLGLIEGVSDGLSSLAKMSSGYYTDRLQRRKPVAIVGYVVTALGTASFGLATSAWHVMVARTGAWLGRGVRTPVRKALLAAAVTRETYGRAFGLERMMDTIGAIVGPVTALVLLELLPHRYSLLFALTLIPSLAAAGVITFLVKETERRPVSHITFGQRLRLLPAGYRLFATAAGLFGAGAFAPTLLILFAIRALTPSMGAARAGTVAVALYLLRNVFNATFAFIAGWLGDRFEKKILLAAGYSLFAIMCLCIVFLPPHVWTLAVIFALAGISVAFEETLEDSLCAELVTEENHGVAFGALAAINGVGDLLSSVIVGGLWTAMGTGAAFGFSASLSLAGAVLISMPAKRASD
jgi:MFS family permease